MRVGREMLRNLGCLRKPSTARCRLSSSRRARPSIRPHSLHSAIPLASPACGFPPASARALLSANVALARRLAALLVEPRLLQQVMGGFRAFEADAAVVFPGKREQRKRPEQTVSSSKTASPAWAVEAAACTVAPIFSSTPAISGAGLPASVHETRRPLAIASDSDAPKSSMVFRDARGATIATEEDAARCPRRAFARRRRP